MDSSDNFAARVGGLGAPAHLDLLRDDKKPTCPLLQTQILHHLPHRSQHHHLRHPRRSLPAFPQNTHFRPLASHTPSRAPQAFRVLPPLHFSFRLPRRHLTRFGSAAAVVPGELHGGHDRVEDLFSDNGAVGFGGVRKQLHAAGVSAGLQF